MRACTVAATWCVLIGLAALAPAQTATLTITHNDLDGVVTPGETVQITATLAWQGLASSGLGWIRGNVRATADLGVASNPVFPYAYPVLPGTLVEPGTPSGGSMPGIHIRSGDVGPAFGFAPTPPWSLNSGLHVARFDWTAPSTPGVISFDWTPDPLELSPVFFSPGQFGGLPISTTYFGTSLTVVPAPASALWLALGLAALSVRCRR